MQITIRVSGEDVNGSLILQAVTSISFCLPEEVEGYAMKGNACQRTRRTLMCLWLIAVLFVMINGPTEVAAWTVPWSESFDNTDYLDPLETTATGWGEGEVWIPYKDATFIDNCSSSYTSGYRPGVFDDYIYLPVSYEGIDVIDISTPTKPEYEAFIEGTQPNFMASLAGFGYLCDLVDGLRILNLTNVDAPVEVANYNPAPILHITLDGSYAYLSTDGEGIHVLDVSNPLVPVSVCNYTQVNATSVSQTQKVGNYLFAVESGAPYSDYGVQIINATDPTAITYMSRCVVPHHGVNLRVSGDTIYLAGYHSALYVISVATSLWSPELVGAISVPGIGYPGCMAFSGDYAYGALGNLAMFNVTDIVDPRIDFVSFDQNPPTLRWIVILGVYLYTSGGEYGNSWVGVYELDDALTAIAQSLPHFPDYGGLIAEATLTIDADVPGSTSIGYQLSADNGTHWEQVTPGTNHVFTINGKGIAWRAVLSTTAAAVTPKVHSFGLSIKVLRTPPELLSISYQEGYNEPIFFFDSSYHPILFQMDTVQTFDSPSLINKTGTYFGGAITGYGVKVTGWNNGTLISYLANGTYYYRFAGIDNENDIGFWSDVATLHIGTTPSTTGIIPPDLLMVLVIGGAIGVVIVFIVAVKSRKST